MATYTSMTWLRNGIAQQKGIYPVQVDAANLDMKQFDAGAADYDQFDIYIRFGYGLSIARGDQLQDESNPGDLYTVSNKPEPFPDGHIQIEAMLKVGS